MTLVWKTDKGAGLRLGESELVLNEGPPKAPETDITVESAEQAAQRFVAAGGSIISGPFAIKTTPTPPGPGPNEPLPLAAGCREVPLYDPYPI